MANSLRCDEVVEIGDGAMRWGEVGGASRGWDASRPGISICRRAGRHDLSDTGRAIKTSSIDLSAFTWM